MRIRKVEDTREDTGNVWLIKTDSEGNTVPYGE